jgi:hypothetical protein
VDPGLLQQGIIGIGAFGMHLQKTVQHLQRFFRTTFFPKKAYSFLVLEQFFTIPGS